ncbi:hypothetical protein HKD37_09G024875 [Glycine soja]
MNHMLIVRMHSILLSRDDVLQWARSVAHENGFVAVIIRSDTNTGCRERISFVLIGRERSAEYRCRKKEFVRRDTGTRKCGCPFNLRGKPVGTLVDCPSEQQFDECLKKFERVCSLWPMFVDYVKETWIIPLIKAGNTQGTDFTAHHSAYFRKRALEAARGAAFVDIPRVESTHWALKRVLQNSLGDLCSAWDAMNNMMTLQHTEIKASFETSTHVVEHVFKKTYTRGFLEWFQGLSEAKVTIKEEMETISKRFEELDVCGKFTLKSKLREISYPDQNSMCPPLAKPFIHDFIDNIVDVKADGNCGYRLVASLLGMGEDSWLLVRNHLLKELGKFSDDYIKLFGGMDRFEELTMSLLVDGLTKVTMDKWMDITNMGYIIASRYNVILVSLSQQQSMTLFPLRSQPPPDSSVHRIICIGHVYDNHFVEVYLKDRCPLSPVALLWSSNCHPQAKQWPTPYISRMQHYRSFMMFKRDYVDIKDD